MFLRTWLYTVEHFTAVLLLVLYHENIVFSYFWVGYAILIVEHLALWIKEICLFLRVAGAMFVLCNIIGKFSLSVKSK